jgi:localization factor PodJL
MKPGIPWSIKGVEPELREVAKTAARRSGMTLGEWLNSAINEQADDKEPASAPAKVGRSRISSHPIERAATRLEDIAEQLAQLARRETDTRAHVPAQSADESFHFAKVLTRVESNERQTVEAFSAVNDRLATLSRQITQANRPAPAAAPVKAEDTPGFQTLEKAVRNIVEHLEVSDKRTRDNLKSLQDRMADMATKAGGTNNDQVLRQAPAFSQLESRLSELARRVDQSQNQTPADLPDILRRELESLAGRIETVRDTAETLASKAQTQAVQASQEELRIIEQRILGLLREAQTSFVSSSTNPAEIQRFRAEIDRLNGRIDEASQNTASSRDVTALRSAVEQLSTRVAQGPDMRPIADMDKRILEISQRLEQSHSATRDLPQINELERRMVELDHRLNDAIRLQGDGAARIELEDKLAEVNDRLGRTENQLTHLGTIEKAISQLYESIEQNRNWTKEVAEDAAHRMGQHIMGQQSGPVNLQGSPEIMALEQGLHAVREASHHADSRNQETLEAVHETLEQIVSKLAELETAAIGQRVAQAAAPAPLSAAENLVDFAPDMDLPEIKASPFASDPIVSSAMMQEPEPVQVFEAPTQAVENPFEEAVAAPLASPFEAIMAGASAAPQTAAGAVDFLAMARAAQAASNQKSLLSGISPAAARFSEEKSRKLLSFKLPFKKAGKPIKSTALPGDLKLPPEIKPANNNVAGSRRTLVLSGILLLSMFAFFIGKNVLGGAAQNVEIETPAAIEKPMDAAPAPTMAPAPADQPAVQGAAPAAPQAAPLEQNSAMPIPEQHSEADPQAGSDEILTGSLPAALAPLASTTASVAVDEAVGPSELREAAATGDANAQFVVATRYMNGENVSVDFAKAAFWYGKAAASGLAPAQYRVATLYERGKGVDKDLKAALSWYERAASLGNVRSMHNAAVIAAGNEAGGPDYVRAYKWFSLAANHGLKDSQFNLAVLMERGLGTKADAVEALFWYYAAAAQQDGDAKTHADALAKSLSPDAVAKIKTRLNSWKPETSPNIANVVAIDDSAWKVGLAKQQVAAAAPQVPQNLIGTTQSLLDKLGYKIGLADGKMGGRTANAIRLFQLQEGMKVTGEVTPELVNVLQSKTS